MTRACRTKVTAVAGLLGVGVTLATGQEAQRFQGKTIQEWIAQWSSEKYQARREAQQAVTRIGKPAVPSMVELIERNDARSGVAFRVLGDMGGDAESALPLLFRVARDRERPTPEKWTWNVPPRLLCIQALGKMSWAATRVIPVLEGTALDQKDEQDARSWATGALRGLGEPAVPSLRKLARSDNDEVRKRAHLALADLLPEGRREYLAQLLEEDPLDPNAPEYLGRTKGIYNSGRLDPLTERVKAALRERLRESPDPAIAWSLVEILQDQLSGTSIQWAAPTDSYRSRSDRENPKESFATVAEVADVGFRSAKKGSAPWRRFGIGLAKLRLLQGDWAGMNKALQALGQKPIAAKDRQWLPAPPVDWEGDLSARWVTADEKMRSGTCGLRVRVEKDGKGLKGVQVMLKAAPKPSRSFSTGIAADTLFLSPMPFDRHLGSYGYRAPDREATRFAVTDASGVASFRRLPKMAVKIEILVPTANFPEAGPRWEMWMEVAPGEFKLASGGPGPNAIWPPDSPPATVELKEGKTVDYARLVVRPRFGLNVYDWARVDRKTFELTWPAVEATAKSKAVVYELEMGLAALQEHPGLTETTPVLQSAKTTTPALRWEVGKRGVGKLGLEPGNIYTLRVTAMHDGGDVISRSPLTRVWVPWEHRATDPPVYGIRNQRSVPITHGKWWRGSRSYGNGKKENLRQQVERFLRESPRAFEAEYVRMGEAWLDWRDGDRAGARKGLARLTEELPPGSVARATAMSLLRSIDQGASCPKRLSFVAPEP